MGWFSSIVSMGKKLLPSAVNIAKKGSNILSHIGKTSGVVSNLAGKVGQFANQVSDANHGTTLGKIAGLIGGGAGKVGAVADKVGTISGMIRDKVDHLTNKYGGNPEESGAY